MGDAASVCTDAVGWRRRGPGLPGARCHRLGTDSFQAKGKHSNSLTFELPGTLFTLAARVAVLQILNTVLGAIWGLPQSPRPAWGWPGRGEAGAPILAEVAGVASQARLPEGSRAPPCRWLSVFRAGETPWGSPFSSTPQPIHLIIRFSVSGREPCGGGGGLSGAGSDHFLDHFLDLCV